MQRIMSHAIGVLACIGCLACACAAAQQAAGAMEAKVVVDDLAGPVRLAVSPNGQTLSVLRMESGDVLGVDLSDPAKRWTAVAAAAGIEPRAVAAIDSSTLALVVREADTWSIRVHRLQAPLTPAGADPVQSVKLGTSQSTEDRSRIIVGPQRDWLAVIGLPDPMPKLVRMTVTGARLGTPSERRCPPMADRPEAVTVGTAGEWGLFLPPAADAPGPSTQLAWVSPSGAQRLLQLETGLERVADAACCRETGLLWAIAAGTTAGGAEGLWRVDAAFVDGRQAARATAIAALPSPTSVICLPKGDVLVSHGTRASRIDRFSPREGGRSASDTGGTKEPGR